MFGRLKDFRRIATRYDRSATNFLAAVCIAATVLWFRTLSREPIQDIDFPGCVLVPPLGSWLDGGADGTSVLVIG